MARVTTKLQVTVPKALAERYGIRPGDEIEWLEAGDAIRVVPAARRRTIGSQEERVALFDQASARQKRREAALSRPKTARARGWTREDLYRRGRPG